MGLLLPQDSTPALPAATSAPAATPLTGLASNTTLMYGIVAVIIVVIIIGAAILLVAQQKTLINRQSNNHNPLFPFLIFLKNKEKTEQMVLRRLWSHFK